MIILHLFLISEWNVQGFEVDKIDKIDKSL